MTSDTVLQKKIGIERCVKQARDYYAQPSDTPFEEDFLIQDAIAVNIQRACEMCIDLANFTIRTKKLGYPNDSAESFALLHRAGIIDGDMERKMKGMVGFRNVVVHQYQDVDLNVMKKIVEKDTNDLLEFAGIMVGLAK